MALSLDQRIGIFQGRLVPSTNGRLQCSPGSRWPEEFVIAGALGMAYIELLGERTPDPQNPIWSSGGRRAMRQAAMDAGLMFVSLCIEEPLDTSLVDAGAAEALAARLAGVVAELPITVVVLPMFEASDLGVVPWTPVTKSIRVLAAALRPYGTLIALELSLTAADSRRFLEAIASPWVGVCYDLGNATAAGFNPSAEIPLLGPWLWHVHAKDKDARGANVRFGTGRVDFAAAFAALAQVGYDGGITIEATRGEDPVTTAAEHRSFLLEIGACARVLGGWGAYHAAPAKGTSRFRGGPRE